MKRLKDFVEYFVLAGVLFAVVAAPIFGVLYLFFPESGGSFLGGWIGGTIGCAIGNGIFNATI